MPRANRCFLPNHIWHITPIAVTKKIFFLNLCVTEDAGVIGCLRPVVASTYAS